MAFDLISRERLEWERERKTSFHALQKPSSLKVTKDPLVNADIGSRPLDKLPVELLEMVFDNLVDEDVIRLSLTSVDLWLMAYRCLQMRYFDRCAPWAGDRLICVGDYARADDLPKAILTKEEIDFIEDQVRQHQAEDLKNEEKKEDLLDEDTPSSKVEDLESDEEEAPESNEDDPSEEEDASNEDTDTSSNAEDSGSDEEEDIPVEATSRPTVCLTRLFPYHQWEKVRPPRSYFWLPINYELEMELLYSYGRHDQVSQVMGRELFASLHKSAVVFDEMQDQILCNLTKREFIRASIVSLIEQPITLGQILISQICWSWDSSASMVDPYKDIHHGRWAGNRFEITTADRVKDLGEWEDITDEIAEKVQKLWDENTWD